MGSAPAVLTGFHPVHVELRHGHAGRHAVIAHGRRLGVALRVVPARLLEADVGPDVEPEADFPAPDENVALPALRAVRGDEEAEATVVDVVEMPRGAERLDL